MKHSTIATALFGAAVFLAAGSASATLIVDNGDAVTIPGDDTQFLGVVKSEALADAKSGRTGPGTWSVNFTAEYDLTAASEATISKLVADSFADLTLSWVNAADDSVLASTPITPTDVTLNTAFTAPDSLSQNLVVSWSDSLTGAGFDVDVVAQVSVPEPSTAVLLSLGLVGLGLTRVSRSKQ